MIKNFAATLVLAVSSLTAAEAPPASALPAVKLKVGDPAPELKVSQWYKGGPVSLESDKNYIVECWSTWCGPCISAFPHLTELAKANDGKITVIGVDVCERQKPEAVKSFVDGQGDKMGYHVAAESEGSVTGTWLKAAGKNSIPCAFVVIKGKIAWIGDPMALTQPLLTSILDGSADLAALAKAAEQEALADSYFTIHVMPLMKKNDYAGHAYPR